MVTKIEVSTVSQCDNGCIYCPSLNKDMVRKSCKKYMTFEDAKNYFSKIPKPTEIYFGGHSDPMRAPDIADIANYLVGDGRFVFMLTTLHKVSVTTVRKVFSIKGIHARLHIPDTNGYTKMVLTQDLIRNYELAIRLIRLNGGKVYACCWGDIPSELVSVFDGVEIESNMQNLCDFGGNVKHEWFTPYNISGPIRCRRGHLCTHLLPDGKLSVCETDWALNHIIGDLNMNTYNEILEGDSYANYNRILLSDNIDCVCRHCTDAINVEVGYLNVKQE